MNLSVVVPTKNEEKNIGACLDAFVDFVKTGQTLFDKIELIVVDNFSTDRTREIAAAKGANVLLQGPERCAQRNRGWREAKGEWVLFLDADMIAPSALIAEILSVITPSFNHAASQFSDSISISSPCLCASVLKKTESDHRCPPSTSNLQPSTSPSAYWIPEVRTGTGLRLAARNFERSFYNGTVIDGFRLLKRSALERIGGYDENLIACEDWDLDRRLLASGAQGALLASHLFHNEARQSLATLLRKKAYYSTSVDRYREKWHNDEICRRQFGIGYRFFGVFFANGGWKRLLRHPLLAGVMYFERSLVAFTYLTHRNGVGDVADRRKIMETASCR